MQRYDPNTTGVKYYCISINYNDIGIVFKFTISQLSESRFVIRVFEQSIISKGSETVVFKYNDDNVKENCDIQCPYSDFLEYLYDNTYEYDNLVSACLGDFYMSKQTDMIYMYYLSPEGKLIKLFDYSKSKEDFTYEYL